MEAAHTLSPTVRIGSLFSGILGIELGLIYHLAASTKRPIISWACDSDKSTHPILSHYTDTVYDDVRVCENMLRENDVDVLVAGSPCQGFSLAGKKKGLRDPRSALMDYIPDIASQKVGSIPIIIWENVPNSNWEYLRNMLWGKGYKCRTIALAASSIGAPHRRNRRFLLATHWSASATELLGEGLGGRTWTRRGALLPTPTASMSTGPSRAGRSGGPNLQTALQEGAIFDVEEALNIWEKVIGRPAPEHPTSAPVPPRFAEWMMGFPLGHVTEHHELSKTAQLRLLGNACVPQQAAEAIRRLVALEA